MESMAWNNTQNRGGGSRTGYPPEEEAASNRPRARSRQALHILFLTYVYVYIYCMKVSIKI